MDLVDLSVVYVCVNSNGMFLGLQIDNNESVFGENVFGFVNWWDSLGSTNWVINKYDQHCSTSHMVVIDDGIVVTDGIVLLFEWNVAVLVELILGVMVIKWNDKRSVANISNVHRKMTMPNRLMTFDPIRVLQFWVWKFFILQL